MATKNNLIARLMDRAKKSEKGVSVFTLKDLDIDITLEEPSNELVNDAFEYKDGEKGDQFILYASIIEPNFKELGKQLKDDGVIGTPIDLVRFINIKQPVVKIGYELQEIGQPDLEGILKDFVKKHKLDKKM